MNASMQISFYGSSLTSSYWNGAATYYRGIIRALHGLGHRVTFYEPDALGRREHRDLEDVDWAEVVMYPAESEDDVAAAIAQGADAEVVIKASGVGVFDEFLEREIASLRGDSRIVAYWDVDAPATLERLWRDSDDPFRALALEYDIVLTYGGGEPVCRAYSELGVERCVPIYNAHDPSVHFPTERIERFECDLAFLGNRLPDRENRVDSFFFETARRLPHRTFAIGGSGWSADESPPNVRVLGHVYVHEHNDFNSSSLAILNISRDSMARFGFSPATRVFEAAAAGACIITDDWDGIDHFFQPDAEILVARSGRDVAAILESLIPERAAQIGAAARQRALAEHTYEGRARQVVEELAALRAAAAGKATVS